jgi:SAM-dependent methyltransferase
VESVERRDEAVGKVWSPDYSGRVFSPEEIERGEHRKFVGGLWDEMGELQRDFLVAQGLAPSHRFLDVGCGSFRAGRHLIDYLEPGHYYGVDANASIIETGYHVELTDEQRARLPLANLRANDRFDADFGVEFDYAIAQSVFTHLSLNHVRLCLARLEPVMKVGGTFYATAFVEPASTPVDAVVQKGERPRFTERNIYWYYANDLKWAASFGPWEYRYIGNWGHPRGQRMFAFTRIESAPSAKPAPAQRSLRQRIGRAIAGS